MKLVVHDKEIEQLRKFQENVVRLVWWVLGIIGTSIASVIGFYIQK